MNLEHPREDGNTKLAHMSKVHFERNCSHWLPDQTRALVRSQAGPGAGAALMVTPSNRETTIRPTSSVLCCSDDFAWLFPSLYAVAPVADHLILVAIIGRLAHRQGCLDDVGMLWRAS